MEHGIYALSAERRRAARRRTILSCCVQAFTGPAFAIAVFGTVAVLFLGAFQDLYALFTMDGLMEFGYHRTVFESAIASDLMTMALPVLSALPYTASYLDDIRSGFIKEYCPAPPAGAT